MNFLRILCALGALAPMMAAQAQAQTASVAVPAATAAAPSGQACCTAANGTPVDLELVDPLSSKVQKRGDTFHIKLSSALELDGKLLLPAGVEGMGEIIDAEPAGGGGAPGKMLVAARYLSWNGANIPLRGTKLGGTGKNHTQAALAAGIAVGVFGMFVHGGNIEFPPGTHVEAKLAVDAVLPPLPPSATMPVATPDPASSDRVSPAAAATMTGSNAPRAAAGLPSSSTANDHPQE